VRYIIFVIDNQTRSATGDDMAKIDHFNQMLRDNGHWITAAGISGPENAILIDNRGRLEIQSGSLCDGSDFYSGFWLVETDSPEAALEIAKQGSAACNRRVELRPYL
jgi:hypothetical protein